MRFSQIKGKLTETMRRQNQMTKPLFLLSQTYVVHPPLPRVPHQLNCHFMLFSHCNLALHFSARVVFPIWPKRGPFV